MTAIITSALVAVPARNEAANVASCLTSIDRAAAHCVIPVVVIVAADSCVDDTAEIARRVPVQHTTVHVIEGRWHGAGRARAAALDWALPAAETSGVWIANTDADCTVHPTWLRRQLRHASHGAGAVAGTITLDPAATPPHLLAQFTATYHLSGPTHHHVHGANLGVRADAYRFVGGWSTHTVVGEEHVLWRRLAAADLHLAQPTDVTVTTSSRTVGRVTGGFASTLSRLQRRPDDSTLTA